MKPSLKLQLNNGAWNHISSLKSEFLVKKEKKIQAQKVELNSIAKRKKRTCRTWDSNPVKALLLVSAHTRV